MTTKDEADEKARQALVDEGFIDNAFNLPGYSRVSKIWEHVATTIEAEARGSIEDGTDFEREHRARYLMRMARLAEAAWWRATGESGTFDLDNAKVDIERHFVKS
jgi:hypothetical protein